MASKARFGRLPRSAPSLTATIVALQAQYQSVRESNIVDAWKSGGEFEGKPVTDEMMMKWWRGRRDELSPSDPKWDYYDNQLTQYRFAIANSKMELKYARKDVTDGEMATFYHQWANKLPPHSEAWRQRETLAAQYAERERSGNAAASHAASERAYNNEVQKNFKHEFAYDTQLTFITQAARDRGILGKGETLENIDPASADGARINDLWDEINTSDDYADDRAFYTKQIKEHGDPHFDGDFSQDGFNRQNRVKNANVTDRIRRARRTGHEADVTAGKKERAGVRGVKIVTKGFDETEEYEQARKEWTDVFENPDATPTEIDRATAEYKGDLERIRDHLKNQKRPDEDDPRVGWVSNELETLNGNENPLEHWGGGATTRPGVENSGGAHATATAQAVKQNQKDIVDLTTWVGGKPAFVLTKIEPQSGDLIGTTPDNHKAATWGVVPIDKVPPDSTFVIQADQGDPRAGKIMTTVSPTPIHTTADVPDTRKSAQPGATRTVKSDKPVGYSYTYPDGTTGYKYKDLAGNDQYTPDNPFVTLDPTTGQPVMDPATGSPVPANVQQGTGKNPSLIATGPGIAPPTGPTVINPDHGKPNTNSVMVRVGKSGYSSWLIGSPKSNGAAYTQKPEDIIAMLDLETPPGPNHDAQVALKIVDADSHRAMYVGDSTEEQQRIRRNFLTGAPNPVPLNRVGIDRGILPAGMKQGIGGGTPTEAGMYQALVGGGRDQVIEDMRETDRGRLTGAPTKPLSLESQMRKLNMSPSPPNPLGTPKESPTSLGSAFSGGVISTLTTYLSAATGKRLVPYNLQHPGTAAGASQPDVFGHTPSNAPAPNKPPPVDKNSKGYNKATRAAPLRPTRSKAGRVNIYGQDGELTGYNEGGSLYGRTVS